MGWRMHLEAERGDTSMLMPVKESGREETCSSFALLLPQTLVQSIPFSGNPGISTITLQVMGNGGGRRKCHLIFLPIGQRHFQVQAEGGWLHWC